MRNPNSTHPHRYDLIGDIHGHHDKLVALLRTLGYTPRHPGGFTGWHHPENRRVIFLGDYIDRGPSARDVLRTVRGMVDAEDALAIAGNHEFNAICFGTPDGHGGWLRERRRDRDAGHWETLRQFEGCEDEWRSWLEWMRELPMFLERDGLRAVHACWDAERIDRIRKESLADDEFLHRASNRGSPEHGAIEHVLKGPEVAMPEGMTIPDQNGVFRPATRVRWWNLPTGGATIGEIAMPDPQPVDLTVPEDRFAELPNYASGEPPVFFGHYWLRPDRPRAPLTSNAACLDYSAAAGDNPVVAYRWNGEQRLLPENFIVPAAGIEPARPKMANGF